MRISMYSEQEEMALPRRHWDLALVGVPIDARGTRAREFVRQSSTRTVEVLFDATTVELSIDKVGASLEDMEALLGNANASILLETTTLGFAELALACRFLRSAGVLDFWMLYVEPKEYFAQRSVDFLHERIFDLSDEVLNYSGIPGATFVLEEDVNQRIVFLVGYEGQRLDQAFEQLPLSPGRTLIVFGVPAFRPGWEMNSFANNVGFMRERNISGGVSFCGANNPAAALSILEGLRGELGLTERMFVVPVGTKPHGIATALFSAANPDVGVIYDHPKRRQGSSQEIGNWHLYRARTK